MTPANTIKTSLAMLATAVVVSCGPSSSGTNTNGSGGSTGGTASGGTGTGGMTVGSGGAAGGTGPGSGGSTGTGGVASTGGIFGTGGNSGTAGAALGGSTGKGGVGGSAGSPVISTGGAGGAVSGAIYVAPDGSDSNPGTMAQPLQTLSKARDVARTRTASMAADLVVYLRGGTYPLASTVTFSNADSGQNGFSVKYMAYPGERPLISGGQAITGWKLSDAANNVYAASGVTGTFRQLYVNGVKAIRARTPNLGANGAANFSRLTGTSSSAHTLSFPSGGATTWNNLTKVEMHLMLAWADNTLRLASMTTSGSTATVKIQNPEDSILYVRPFAGLHSNACYYLENALEFLDQPGEWYLDETAGVLYYKPRAGEDMTKATVVAPMVETLVAIEGTSTTSQAGYLWFQGLTFAHSTWLRPSQMGFLDGQAGQYNITATADNKQTVGRPAAGVSVTNANHIHFERNLFTEMGATGLDFVSGTHDDMVIGNVFADIAGNGISVGKFTASDTTEFHIPYNPTDTNEICTKDTIKDNYVTNVTTEFQGSCGIAAGYPRMLDVEHNEISYVNYTGISVGYGWTAMANAMSNNTINYNNVHHVTQILADGASIYTLSNQGPASQMEYNYVHDYAKSAWADYGVSGLYLDEGTSYYTVAHNVMMNAPTSITQNHDGAGVMVSDNSGSSPTTISSAGIESAYADIKTLTIPAY